MTEYDPRTATGIPTEPVGSLPRPSKLQAAYAAYDEGKIDKDALEAEQDAAARDSIERFEAPGSPIISDGEQRWSSFATYPITDTLGGTAVSPGRPPSGPALAIFPDGHGRPRARPGARPQRAVLRDLRPRPGSATAQHPARALPLPPARRRLAEEVEA